PNRGAVRRGSVAEIQQTSLASTAPVPWLCDKGVAIGLLVVIVLAELALAGEYYERRWHEVILPRAAQGARAGAGLGIQWNGLGYYAWLRSLLHDGDWEFDNEFDEHNPLRNYVPPKTYRTPINRRANQWSVGPACVWAGAVMPGHFLLRACGGSDWPEA